MKIRGAIFDLDGTLLDSMAIWETIGSAYIKTRGIIPPADLPEILKPMSMLQAACYLKSRFGFEESTEEITAQINALLEKRYRYDIRLKLSVMQFLKKLDSKGVKLCIATATDRYLVEAALERLDIIRYFCGIITCSEAGCGKDKPTIYYKALELLKTKKDETIIFEDAMYAVKTAKAAGFMVTGVHDASAEEDKEQIIALADWYNNSFDEWKDDWEIE